MDPVIVIPETRNTSSTVENVTEHLEPLSRCTPLDELDLADTFTGMDIGNSEFWGSMSGFWKPCFIIYCALFYAALLILCGVCVGLLCYTLKRAAYSRRTLVYLLTLCIIWSTLSLAHGILMIISTASGSDSGLSHAIIILDTITSASFVSIMLVAIVSFLDAMIHFTLRYALLSTLIIFVEAVIIVILSIPVGISVTLIFVCMIILRSLIFITSVILLFVVIFFKNNSLSAKELICMLWKDNKVLLIIMFPYFLLLYTYYLYTLITVLSNNNCTEDIQLQRAVWLVFNSLLRICEASFSASYFMKAITIFREPKQTLIMHYNFSIKDKPEKPVGKSIDQSDMEEEQHYSKSLCTAEIERLHRTTKVDVERLSHSLSWSTVTSRLHNMSQSVDSDRFLDVASYSSSDTLNDDPSYQVLKYRVTKYMQPDLLDFNTLIPLLNKYHLLTQANMYDLKNPLVAPTKRANELVYHILPSKGPGAYMLFIKCLQEEKEHMGHQALVRLFTQCENDNHQNPPISPPQPIEDPTNQSAATTSPPTEKECDMKTMYKYVVNKLAPHWTTVGDYLGYSVRERNSFKGADDKKSLIALLENWIGTDSGMKPKTWSTFIGILMELDQDLSISVGNEIYVRLKRELSNSALPESFV